MKKSILKGAILGLVFFIALIVLSSVMNKGNTDLTAEMAPATFPVVYMTMEDIRYNELHGYGEVMDTAYMRNNITPLGENRDTSFLIEKYNTNVQSVSYELRSVDGERLIENGEITNYKEDGDTIQASIAFKDLIEKNQEYALTILAQIGEGQVVRYYTRVVWSDNYYGKEKIAYVIDFNEKTFDKEAASDLTKYLETNAEGDNTTLHKVTIHSSLSQLTWADLEPVRESTPVVDLVELASQTASLRVHYVVSTVENAQTMYYYVEEFYRIRYTATRTYLLDFERTMNRFFQETESVYANNKIIVGIGDQDLPFIESEDGNNFAFLVQNKLCSYSVTDNKVAVLFSFYDADNADERTIYNNHRIKILSVDEAGNVTFVVYGYMNRGRHEGEVGIQLYTYNSTLNTIEELAYIPNHKSPEILMAEMEELLYVSRENYLYLTLENVVYEIDLGSKTYEVIIDTVQDGSLQVSDSHSVIAWQTGADAYASQEIVLMSLQSREKLEIRGQSDEYIMPLGFMGEDLIYGYAKMEDVKQDGAGRTLFPMYKIYILGADGTLLMQYEQSGIYITGCTIESNQITLSRSIRSEEGEYVSTTADQIMNNQEQSVGQNQVGLATTARYEKIVQISVKKDINTRTIQVRTPKEVLFEGGRNLELERTDAQSRFYVYGAEGIHGIFRNPASAVDLAYEISGVVVGETGDYVWIRGNRVSRNQIMAITGSSVTEEKDSVAVCLDTILRYEGVMRNTEYLLAQGETIYSVLEKNLPQAQILDLKGCALDAVLYYVNRDIPVFASLRDGSAVLIVGFNEYNIMIMNPLTGALERRGINDSTQWFEENGNGFITYVPLD